MSADKPIVIRDPRIFVNDRTVQENRTPFELTTGGFCDSRNAATKPYQNYSSYSSSVENLSALVNRASEICVEPFIVQERLFKCAEDVCGNVYLLFKDIENENTITTKKEFLGRLFVFDSGGEPLSNLGGLVVEDLALSDVNVFYDKIVLVGEEQVWLATCRDFQFCTLGYMSFFKVIADEDDNPLFFSDPVVNEFSLKKFDGKEVITISEEDLGAIVSSGTMNLKNGRIEVFITNTDVPFFQTLQVYEYDLCEGVWDGVEFSDFSYEVLGGYSENGKWYVFHEQLTYPNFVGGTCYGIEIPVEEIEGDDPCKKKPDLYLTYDGEESNSLGEKVNIVWFHTNNTIGRFEFKEIDNSQISNEVNVTITGFDFGSTIPFPKFGDWSLTDMMEFDGNEATFVAENFSSQEVGFFRINLETGVGVALHVIGGVDVGGGLINRMGSLGFIEGKAYTLNNFGQPDIWEYDSGNGTLTSTNSSYTEVGVDFRWSGGGIANYQGRYFAVMKDTTNSLNLLMEIIEDSGNFVINSLGTIDGDYNITGLTNVPDLGLFFMDGNGGMLHRLNLNDLSSQPLEATQSFLAGTIQGIYGTYRFGEFTEFPPAPEFPF